MTHKNYAHKAAFIKAFFCLLFSFFSFILKAQTGPGGVGTTDGTSNLTFWIKASEQFYTTNNTTTGIVDLDSIIDVSGDNHVMYAPTTETTPAVAFDCRPRYQENVINGWPAIQFTGVPQYLEGPTSVEVLGSSALSRISTEHTIYHIVQNPVSGRGAGYISSLKYEQSGNTSSRSMAVVTMNINTSQKYVLDNMGISVLEADNALGSENLYFYADNNGGNAFSTDPIMSGAFFIPKENSRLYINGDLRIDTKTDDGLRERFGSSQLFTDNFSIGARTLGGTFHAEMYLAETIIFNRELTEVERIILENYLSSKYAITLSANDKFTLENYGGNQEFFYDVAGIGQDNNSEQHTSSNSSLLQVSSSALANDDTYFMLGHDNAGISTWRKYVSGLNNEIPEGNVATLDREWRVEHSLTNENITLSWDISNAPTETSYDQYYLLVDADGDFTEDIKAAYQMTVSGTDASITIPANFLTSGDYLKLGIAAAPASPQNVKAENYLHLRSLISWDAVAEDVRGNPIDVDEDNIQYQVFFATSNDFALASLGATTSSTSTYVDVPDNRETYYFWVVAQTIQPLLSSSESTVVSAYTGVVIAWRDTEIFNQELDPSEIGNVELFISDTIASEISYEIIVGGQEGLNSVYDATLSNAGQDYEVDDQLVSTDIDATTKAVIQVNKVGASGDIEEYSMITGGTGYTWSTNDFVSFDYSGGSGTGATFQVKIQNNSDFEFDPDDPQEALSIFGTINETSQEFNSADLGLTADSYVEPDESFTLTIANVSSENGQYVPDILSGSEELSYTIQDDDNDRKIYFEVDALTVNEEDGSIQIPVVTNLADGINDTQVSYIITGGTATEGSDSSDDYELVNVPITIPAGSSTLKDFINITINSTDNIFDDGETIIIQLVDPVNCNLGNDPNNSDPALLKYNTVTITIKDTKLPKVSFDNSSATYSESDGTVYLNVSSDIPSSNPLQIGYTYSGTATPNTDEGSQNIDYTYDEIFTFDANSTEAQIELDLFVDNVYEGNETIIFTLNSSSTNEVASGSEQMNITLEDDQSPPIVSFASFLKSDNEANAATIPVTFEANIASQVLAKITYTIDMDGVDDATEGSDFNDLESKEFTMPPTLGLDEFEYTIDLIEIIDDDEVEAPENIVIKFDILGMDDATASATDSLIIKIFDNELGPDGPGGVGSVGNNILWLRSDRGVYTDVNATSEAANSGDAVGRWNDQSGNNNHFTIPSTTALSFNSSSTNLNSQPTVSFPVANNGLIGVDSDEMIGLNTNFLSSFIVFTSLQTDQSNLISVKDDDSDVTTSLYAIGLNKDNEGGDLPGAISLETNGGEGQYIYFNENFQSKQASMVFSYAQGEDSRGLFIDGEGRGTADNGISVATGNTEDVTIGSLDNSTEIFEGDLAEVIMFNTSLNNIQRIIIENYLAEKYNISITNDYYDNSIFNHEVTGIGNDGSNIHDRAKGSGLVLIENPTDLEETEYLFWGENAQEGYTFIEDELSSSLNNIWDKKWYVDYSDATMSNNDGIGEVDISIYYPELPGHPADVNHIKLVVSQNPNFTYASNPLIISHTSYENDYYTFKGVTLSDGYYFTLGSTSDETLLPVELLAFEVQQDGGVAKVKWSTASELNNDHFLVEKSKDGIEWEYVTEVKGHGTTSESKEYSVDDQLTFYGTTFYRLTQFDFDGKSEVLGIRSVTYHPDDQSLEVFPNPTKDGILTIRLNESVELNRSQIRLRDLSGRLIDYSIVNTTGSEVTIQVKDSVGFFILQVGNQVYRKILRSYE